MLKGWPAIVSLVAASAGISLATSAQAADVAAPATATEACKVALSAPAFNGPIKANPNPSCFNAGPLGEIYVGGAATGYAYTQSNPFPFSTFPIPNDRYARVDVSNIQAWVQKADGPFQFFVQAGAYAIPALGFINPKSFDQTDLLFTPLPVAYGKFQLSDAFSFQFGRMPTLIGSEAPFTFQNLNIQRGLLFNQENIINHGVQLNYSEGPWSVSVAGTDGFFSESISWFTGSVSYKLDDSNTFGVNGGFNAGRTDVRTRSLRYQYATPLLQQNSGIFNVNYTYSNGPWTITPYFQFTNVARDNALGIVTGASTYGGALLASYAFTDNFALAGRVEYEEQTGRRGSGTTSLLYGAGSSALSFTVTPTFTYDRFFVRGEYSYVQLYGITRDLTFATLGSGFGRTGNKDNQERYMLELGVTF